ISFKKNSRLDADYKSTTWKELLGLLLDDRWRYLAHYNKRNNVESTFSRIKSKFGSALRSTHKRAQVNEALAKVLCHNLCVLIHAMYELGLKPKFEGVINPDALARACPAKPEPIAAGRVV